jgi:hypothetical protein
VTRHDLPIETVGVSPDVRVNTGISFGNMSYPLWEAAVSCGATLDELLKLDEGSYPTWFVAKFLAYHEIRQSIEMHVEDAKARKMKQQAKKAKRKK